VVVSDIGGRITFWDVATGKEVDRLRGHGDGVFSLALTADGKLLASGAWGKVRLWDASTGTAIAEWDVAKDQVTRIAFSPDGKTAALSYGGNSIELWDVAGAKKLRVLQGHAGTVSNFAFDCDGKLLASGSCEDPNVRLWDVATGKQVRAFPVVDSYRLAASPGQQTALSPGDVLGVAFSPDGKTLATCGNNSPIRFWDPATGKRLREANVTQHATSFTQLHYLPDGKRLASIGPMTVRTLDAETGKMLRESKRANLNVGHLAVSPDGKVLATSWHGSHTFDLWNAATLKPLHSFIGHRERVTALTFAKDGRTLFSASNTNPGNPIYEWDLAACKPLREFGKPPSGGASGLALSPDGRFLFACGFDIHQFDLATGKDVRAFKGHTSHIESVSLSADGKTLASGCYYDHTLRLWDVPTGKERRNIELNQDYPCAAVLSPDGKTVAAGGFRKGAVRVWDTATGKVVHEISTPHQLAYTLAFSPDGKILVVGGVSHVLTLYDAATGKLLRQIDGVRVVRVAFSPDGRTLATAGSDNEVSLWETATGGRRAAFTGHTGAAHALAFSADGKCVASGGDDTTILVWDIAGPPVAKTPAELWADLAGNDAAKAHRAIWSLAAMPQHAVPLVQQHVKPATAPPAEAREQFTRLVADLDSDDFATRQKADLQLEKLGPFAEPLVRQALQNDLSVEVRRRLEKLLDRLDKADEAAWLRTVRALEVLEHAGTPEARELLSKLAAGTPEARLTREAKAALDQLRSPTR
jgi:WD40 repeat protein